MAAVALLPLLLEGLKRPQLCLETQPYLVGLFSLSGLSYPQTQCDDRPGGPGGWTGPKRRVIEFPGPIPKGEINERPFVVR